MSNANRDSEHESAIDPFEKVLQQFEVRWQSGKPPSTAEIAQRVSGFVPVDDGPGGGQVDLLVELITIDLEYS